MFFAFNLSATKYYVSNTGSDSANGLTQATAWQTLAKVNALTPNAGDQILFKRGDEWSGTITINASGISGSPIVYGAYGQGARPVIKGVSAVTGWSLYDGNIYYASLTGSYNQLFEDGERVLYARYPAQVDIPNDDYIAVDTVMGGDPLTQYKGDTIVSAALIGKDWTGATGIFRGVPWAFEARLIEYCDPITGTIKITTDVYGLSNDEPFFIINDTSVVNLANRWAAIGNTAYLWASDGADPDTHTIEVSTEDYGFVGVAKDYITIKSLKIYGFEKNGINLTGDCDNIIIDGCEFKNNYECAVYAYDDLTDNFQIINNDISGSNRNSVMLKGSNHIVNYNKFYDIGLLENIGLDAFVDAYNTCQAMLYFPTTGSGLTFSYNTLYNIGYNGVFFTGLNCNVKFNVVGKACQTLQDGGGIYTNDIATGSIIRRNIVYNCGLSWDISAHGIYMDDGSQGVLIDSNYVYNNYGNGIFLHNTVSDTVKDNLVYNNVGNEFISKADNFNHLTNAAFNNTFFNPTDGVYAMKIQNSASMPNGTNTYNNIIGSPRALPILYVDSVTFASKSLADYKTISGSGVGDTLARIDNYSNSVIFPNRSHNNNKSYNNYPLVYRDMDSIVVDSPYVVSAFSAGLVAFDDTSTTGVKDEYLKLVFDFDETSGSYTDSHSTNVGIPAGTIGRPAGKLDLATDAAGTGYVSVAYNADLCTADFTIGFWFKSPDNAAKKAVMQWVGSDYFSNGISMYSNTDKSITMRYYNSVDYAEISMNFAAWNTWYYVAFTFEQGVSCKAYLDGSLEATDLTPANMYWGAAGGRLGYAYAQGNNLFDQMLYSQRALTITEIQAIYNSGDGLPYANW